jgi:hypothetical protein
MIFIFKYIPNDSANQQQSLLLISFGYIRHDIIWDRENYEIHS